MVSESLASVIRIFLGHRGQTLHFSPDQCERFAAALMIMQSQVKALEAGIGDISQRKLPPRDNVVPFRMATKNSEGAV